MSLLPELEAVAAASQLIWCVLADWCQVLGGGV